MLAEEGTTYLSRIVHSDLAALPARKIEAPVDFVAGRVLDRLQDAILRKRAEWAHVVEEIARKRSELDALHAQLAALIDSAEQKSRDLLESANGEALGIREAAAEAGREDGFRQGVLEAQAAQEALVAEAQAALMLAEQERTARVKGSEESIVKLAIMIAQRLLERELQVDGEYVARLAGELLAEVDQSRRVEIRVAVSDFALTLGERATFERILGDQAECVISPDRTLAQGDVVISTEYGTVDGRLKTRFESVRQILGQIARRWERDGTAVGEV